MTDIECMEADMRKIVCGCVCEVCANSGKSGLKEPCFGCKTPELKGFKWRGRIAEAVEKIGEDAKPDPVNRPAHYTSGGIECIDAMTAAFGDEVVKDFCLCNAFKYLWRHRQKNGVEDLKKARWYLGRLIAEMEVEDDDG